MHRILVTGATGTTGKAVLSALQAQAPAQGVVAAARDPAKLLERNPGTAAVRLDYDDPTSIATALDGVDTLFLVTGYSVEMLLHSKLVLDAARAAGVGHVVHLGAWGSENSPFQHLVWHDFVERYVQSAGFGWTHLQPKTFMGNILTGLRAGSTTICHFYGDTAVGWVDSADIAAVAAACLTEPAKHAGQTYRLSEDARSVEEVARILAEETGLPFVSEARDPQDMMKALEKNGMEPSYAKSLVASVAAVSSDKVPGISEIYGTVLKVTGSPGTTWQEFAWRNRERIIKKATASR